MSEQMSIREKQAEYLHTWLAEWSLYRETAGGSEADDGADLVASVKAPQLGGMIALRQISLLYPDCRATWDRPVYAALIEQLADDRYLAVPFSRFSVPALPGELLTAHAEPQLRVLCVWNSFAIEASRLLSGWQVDSLADDEFEHALELRSCLSSRKSPPASLQLRTRPPLVSPSDPRWDYQEEELEMVESLLLDRPVGGSKTIYEINEMPLSYRAKAAESDSELTD